MKILVLLPARYASTRFPGKPLILIKNKSLILRVYQNLQKLKQWFDTEIAVVTDSQKIEDHLKKNNCNCVRVDDETFSGSERIYLAYERFFKDKSYDFIINVQGDEPLLMAKDLKRLIDFQKKHNYQIATVGTLETDQDLFNDSNSVKVVIGLNHQAIYFSRSPIPFERDCNNSIVQKWIMHAGVYSYTQKSLEKFNSLKVSKLEKLEKLEQLRAIENNIAIGIICLDKKLLGVDSPEDVIRVEKYL